MKDVFNRKISYYFVISGIPDDAGMIRYKLANPIELPSNITFNMALTNFQATSFFTNIDIDRKNNKFYYKEKDQEQKTIIFQSGSYEVEEINKEIVYHFLQDNLKNAISPIRIIMNKSTWHVNLMIEENKDKKYEIDFTKPDTFRNILGFESKIYKDKVNISESPAVLTNKIYISCSIIDGAYNRSGVRRQVFFTFANSFRFGELINIEIKNLQCHPLNQDRFDEILFSFSSDKGDPVNFNKTNVIMSILIQQV